MTMSWVVAFVVMPVAVLFTVGVGVALHERSIQKDEKFTPPKGHEGRRVGAH